MKFCQFSSRRRVLIKRVASICSIGLVSTLSACGYQDLPFSGNSGADRYAEKKNTYIPIPSEPVYGYPDEPEGAGGRYGAPFKTASHGGGYQPASIERTSLTPVSTASNGAYAGNYAGGSYAMQPLDAHKDSAPAASGKRYAQAYTSNSYYGGRSHSDQPSYSDYRPRSRRSYSSDDDHSTYEPRYKKRSYKPTHYDTAASRHEGSYVVVEGDTLYGIAKRYGLSTSELAELNGITGSTIYVGQHLKLSGSPTYTGTSRGRDYRHYSAPSRHGYGNSYEEEERKAPPHYRSYSSAPSYEDADDDEREEAGHVRRYARRYAPAPQRHDNYGPVTRYKKQKGEYFTYSVEPGDTLYDIAQRNGISHRELADYNDIPASATLYPGQVLRIPNGRGYDRSDDDEDDRYSRRDSNGTRRGGDRVPYASKQPEKRQKQARRKLAAANAPREKRKVEASAASDRDADDRAASRGEPRTILAAHRDVDAKSSAPRNAESGKDQCDSLLAQPVARSGQTFRQPVEGLIAAKFGARPDGSFNDGIDFSVPKGTPVKSAENGVVAYVGNELPGFGNLILVRHSDGYVTAYAHNEEVLVRRCDIVKRGQIISKAGASGKVTKPQLHFELRKDSKAVDPEAFFARS